jgi:hypothetical protein
MRGWGFVVLSVLLSAAASPAHSDCLGRLEGDLRAGGGEYDPFDPLDFRRRQSVTVRNAGSETCDFIVEFRRQPAEGRLARFLSYRLEDTGGQSLLTEQVPPGSGTSYVVLAGVQPGQSASGDYYLVLSRGQFAYAGSYDDDVTLSLHNRDRSGHIAAIEQDAKMLTITQTVKASVTITVAGGGLTTTLNFDELTTGKERLVVLQARANYAYSLVLRSLNGSVLKLDPDSSGRSQPIPYSLRIDSEPVSLTVPAILARSVPRHSWGHANHTLAFRIEDVADRRAGLYRDVVSVDITVNP